MATAIDQLITRQALHLNHEAPYIRLDVNSIDINEPGAMKRLQTLVHDLDIMQGRAQNKIVTDEARQAIDQALKLGQQKLRKLIKRRPTRRKPSARRSMRQVVVNDEPSHQLLNLFAPNTTITFGQDTMAPQVEAEVNRRLKMLEQIRDDEVELMVKSETEEFTIEENCPVCFETAKGARLTKCGHVFCLGCLVRACRVWPRCPVCRSVL